MDSRMEFYSTRRGDEILEYLGRWKLFLIAKEIYNNFFLFVYCLDCIYLDISNYLLFVYRSWIDVGMIEIRIYKYRGLITSIN